MRRIVGTTAPIGVLVAALTTFSSPTGTVDAQDPFEPAEIVSRLPNDNGPMPNGAERASISNLGHILSFASSFTFNVAPEIWHRDRPNSTTGPPTPIIGQNPGLSDDGCVIAYNGDPVAEFTFALMTINRCAGGVSTQVATNGSGFVAPRPSLNADGTVIAFPRRTNALVWRQNGASVTVNAPLSGYIIGEVALSSDGNVLAFVAGRSNGTGGVDSSTTNIWVADVPAGVTNPSSTIISQTPSTGALQNSFDPSISADGQLVAFRQTAGIFVGDRTTGFATSVVPGGGRPAISRDGQYLGFEIFSGDNSDVFIIQTSDRWASASPPELVSYARPGASTFHLETDAVVSEHGRWVAWSTGEPDDFVQDPLFPQSLSFPQSDAILIRQRRPVLSVQSLDFGLRTSPATLQSTVTNVGPSGWRVTSIAANGEFDVATENCPSVLQPGQSCRVDVLFSAAGDGAKSGTLTVRDDSYPGVPLAATGSLVGVSDGGPPTTPPRQSTTTTVPASVGLSITPNPVTFDEAVVGQPAASRAATVVNIGQVPVTVQTVLLSGIAAGDYAVSVDGCTGETLAVGGDCQLTLGFVPSDAGDRVGTLMVSGSGSASASTSLRGSGRFDAVLELTPGVAAGGQVVTLVGSGYPVSTAVTLSLGGLSTVIATTDPNGGFMVPWLILSGTPQGELLGDDVAIIGRYDADPAPLLVVGTPMRPQSTGMLRNTQRRYLSR